MNVLVFLCIKELRMLLLAFLVQLRCSFGISIKTGIKGFKECFRTKSQLNILTYLLARRVTSFCGSFSFPLNVISMSLQLKLFRNILAILFVFSSSAVFLVLFRCHPNYLIIFWFYLILWFLKRTSVHLSISVAPPWCSFFL